MSTKPILFSAQQGCSPIGQKADVVELYLDTEFNGHGGQLLSLALASVDGRSFYARLPDPMKWHPWVEEHVKPFFGIEPEDEEVFRFRLREYLKARDGCTIYADWPADFTYLTSAMVGASFETSFIIGCNLVLLKESEPKPVVPHNALSDAIALMNWHNEPRGLSAAERPVAGRVTPNPVVSNTKEEGT